MFKKNPYIDSIWSERDQEFWWSGIKGGFFTGAACTTMLITGIVLVCEDIKEKRHKKVH